VFPQIVAPFDQVTKARILTGLCDVIVGEAPQVRRLAVHVRTAARVSCISRQVPGSPVSRRTAARPQRERREMNRLRTRTISAVVATLACNGSSTDTIEPGAGVALEVIASGLASPVHLTSPPGDARLFIVEQAGRIRMMRNGQLVQQPFLDIVAKVGSGGERGLLSVAFHPQYATNGLFFVYYTDRSGDTRVERYRVSADPDVADDASAKLILAVDQPFSNHNGGLVVFGPDGKFYVGLGDGGSGGDPQNNGQNRNTLLGSILRIDVDAGDPYAIPADNPFAGQAGARGEIWAWGLRNPWRFAFDRTTDMLYIADVGQNRLEEINVSPATSAGLNYGWNITEGRDCFDAPTCDTSGLTLPVFDYDHGPACSITGGYVYRGSGIADVAGHYFYSDYCAGWIRSFRFANGEVTAETDWGIDAGRVLSFGEDADGELYVLNSDGTVYRMVRAN
jgi:hypothetical protein